MRVSTSTIRGATYFKLREAGARRVVLSSPNRWAVMHELRDEPEARFDGDFYQKPAHATWS